MKLSTATKIIENQIAGTHGTKILSIGDMRRQGHDEVYPQLPKGTYVIAAVTLAIPYENNKE